MAHGTLETLSTSSFVRTPPELGARIYQHLLAFPAADQMVAVLDPAAGEGDLLLPLLDLELGCRVICTGIEISEERALKARTRLEALPSITVIPSAYEGVKVPKGSISLAVLNPPYFFVNGQRAEYTFMMRTTPALVEGGILACLLPARSAWNRTMVAYWTRWFDDIRLWKVPSEAEGATESPFEKYRQIVVVGRKRAIARELDEDLVTSLLRYRWRKDPKYPGEEGWDGKEAPPTLPTEMIPDPYHVPTVSFRAYFDLRNADDAVIMETLRGPETQLGVGADLSSEWAQATSWQEEAQLDHPAMPYTGVAHVAAEIMTGLLGGEVIELDGQPHLLSAFVGSEWSKMTLDDDTKENLRSKGVVSASAKQLQDYPVLGVLNLRRGRTLYYEGTAVFDFLAPHISTLATYAQRKRPPVYQLEPEEWELEVLTQFGIDKQLPKAAFPGLAPAQMHRVVAMARALDAQGLIALQGEPGTGKTRMAIAAAARQAYAWKMRRASSGQAQPAWIRQLRRSWLKNPRTLAMLKLEPVMGARLPNRQRQAQIQEDASTGRVVAYRRTQSGMLILPEEAGPTALPVLVTTPKKVTKEYEKEIRAAWPEAETMMIQRYTDIPRWLQRCASSLAPAVIAICSHSQSQPRGSGRNWQPALIEKERVVRKVVMEPQKELLPSLEPVMREDPVSGEEVLVGYRSRATGEMLMETITRRFFLCPECLQPIQGLPDGVKQDKEGSIEDGPTLLQEDEEEPEDLKETVTSRIWFEKKPRWCTCAGQTRNTERVRQHKKPLKAPLWTESRVTLTQQKYPSLSFDEWSWVLEHSEAPSLRSNAARARAEGVQAEEARVKAKKEREELEEICAREGREVPPAPLEEVPVVPIVVATPRVECRLTSSSEGMASIALSCSRGNKDEAEPSTMRYYDRIAPPPDSFGVYEYLSRFFAGTVALTIVDESHNGRGQNSDIARALHRAMRAAQTHMLTSGTHFGGDIVSFYFYWYRFYPEFWIRLGLSWKQASEALRRYGVIQLWTKEYESDARKGGGKTNVQVSTVPAPGLSAKLIPYLLESLCFLTVLDVGAFMPPKIEIPHIVSMRDPVIEEKRQLAADILIEPMRVLAELHQEKQRLFEAVRDGVAGPDALQDWSQREEGARLELERAHDESQQIKEWMQERDLLGAYFSLVDQLARKARKGNAAARMAQGTIPRWFAVLPCEKPFELWQTERTKWGDAKQKSLVVKTPQLAWDYLYPLERRVIVLVQQELSEGRRVMIYIDQNQERSTAQRLQWVLQQADISCWALPNAVKPEDRQQKIIDVMGTQADGSVGVQVALVPYARVNEGINLQSAIDTIIWYEMALNLFMLEQASRRAWRLGKREEVRIVYMAYAGTAGHQKLRKLGGQSGAAAAFAGEPARGALIEEAGADRTTLARFSETVEAELLIDEDDSSSLLSLLNDDGADDADELSQAFARRAQEERETLQKGRTWIGVVDTLADRLAAFFTSTRQGVWKHRSTQTPVRTVDGSLVVVHDDVSSEIQPDKVVTPAHEHDGTIIGDSQSDTAVPLFPSAEPQKTMPKQQATPTNVHPLARKMSERSKEPPSKQENAQPIARKKKGGIVQKVASRVVGSASALIFGDSEQINMARQRRRKVSQTKAAPKPRVQVEVRNIPAVEPEPAATPSKPATSRPVKRVVVPAMTLWDFAAKQTIIEAQSPISPKPVVITPAPAQPPQDLWSFVAAETAPVEPPVTTAYEQFKAAQYAKATNSCTCAETVLYATWQKDGMWAIRYFIDDEAPVEQRYAGFQTEEHATELIHVAAPASSPQKLSFQEFSHALLERAEREA